MNTYFRLLLSIIFVIVSFGIIGPWLVSAKDTMMVIGGIAYIFVVMPFVLYLINRRYKKAVVKFIADVTAENEKTVKN